ncbi:hypothetical protein [Xanthobacter flavus]|uniref:hypothetical protein n=1 Tax=Xanthobacter flavus TaxID=281 RepID=UPI00372D86AC
MNAEIIARLEQTFEIPEERRSLTEAEIARFLDDIEPLLRKNIEIVEKLEQHARNHGGAPFEGIISPERKKGR